jgi:hypothetical protein
MKQSVPHTGWGVLAVLLCAGLGVSTVRGQALDPGFTHQGELTDAGSPANGNYDFEFRLYDAPVAGSQVGPTLSQTLAVTNGRYVTSPLNFGVASYNGNKRWLQISVRPSGGGAFTPLSPRQELTPAPHAWYAVNAGTATNSVNLNGQPQSFYTNASNLSAGTLPSARLSGTYSSALTFSNVGNVYFGSGANLTGLNASNIASGTISDARLSSNVDLLNTFQTFTAAKTWNANDPIDIIDPNNGGTTVDIQNFGGSSIFINNDASANGLVAYGLNVDVNGTTTRYGSIIDILGTTGTGYTYFGTNASNTGRGLYISMTGTGTNYGVYVSNSSPSGYGGLIQNTATSGTTYGLWVENNSPDGYGLYARHDASTGTGPAIYGQTDSTSASAFAIHGVVVSTAPGASSAAVRGQNNGTGGNGIGVWGSHAGSGWGGYFTTAGGRGVYATATGQGIGVYATTQDGYAVYGIATPTSSTEVCYGVRGIGGNSDNSYGGYFTASGAGIGVYGYSTGGPGGYFDTGVTGGDALYVVGTASVGVITIRGGADLAEHFEVANAAQDVKPGMVVMIDDEHPGAMEIAVGAYNPRVAGIVSGANELSPGMVLGKFDGQENAIPVALTGRVWTYVDATHKSVEPGDMLTTSDTPGYAMPVLDREKAHGAVIGKAMSRLEKGERGLVLVLVNLQ